jgi:hypothetical protein
MWEAQLRTKVAEEEIGGCCVDIARVEHRSQGRFDVAQALQRRLGVRLACNDLGLCADIRVVVLQAA